MSTHLDLDGRLHHRLKAGAVRAVTASGIAGLCRPLTRRAAVVFMLHRFSDPQRGVHGHDQATVRALLAHLRRGGHQLVDLPTLFASLRGDAPPVPHAVAFTIDDGYLDHAEIACPLFAEFDCPVTTFITTGFVDGDLWLWWDQVQYVFARAVRLPLQIDLGNIALSYELDTPRSRRLAAYDFAQRCKAFPGQQKLDTIGELAARAEVALPTSPPSTYAPMTWDQLRACERRGMTFAPHTVTHPILAVAGDAEARTEIEVSWNRLREEAAAPIPIFAYPNGQPGDFGPREFDILRRLQFVGAVTAVEGFATAARYQSTNGAFQVPRFAFPSSLPYLIQQVDGLERLKYMLRRME